MAKLSTYTSTTDLDGTELLPIVEDVATTPVTRKVTAAILGILRVANRQTANYTLVLGDQRKSVEFNKATAGTVTVPPNSSVAFAVDTDIDVYNYGAGPCTITPGAGVTLRSPYGLVLPQYAQCKLRKIATDEWWVINNMPGGYELGSAVSNNASQTINSTTNTLLTNLSVAWTSDGSPVWVACQVAGTAATGDNFVFSVWDGTVGSGTLIYIVTVRGQGGALFTPRFKVTAPTVGARTYNAALACATTGANTFVRDETGGFSLPGQGSIAVFKA